MITQEGTVKKRSRRYPSKISDIILWSPYPILAESIAEQGIVKKRAKTNYRGLEPQNHCPRTQRYPDGNIRNKCYPIPTSPNTTITINPTKFRTHQANGAPNGNPIGYMLKHDRIK